MKQKLYVATKNKHKLEEISSILTNINVSEFENLPEIDETGLTFEENAAIKAIYLSKLVNYPVIADDSGLEVDGLDNAPGVHSARYAGVHGDDKANNDKLLKNMINKTDRACRFVCVIALAKKGKLIKSFRGEVAGTLAFEEMGVNGFGYDPLFITTSGKSMAELSPSEKNAISHRKNALEKLKNYFDTDRTLCANSDF